MRLIERLKHTKNMKPMNKAGVIVGLIVLGICAATAFVSLAGLAVQRIWNATITEIFGTSPISWWQALLLLVLCKILFSSEVRVERHGGGHHHKE